MGWFTNEHPDAVFSEGIIIRKHHHYDLPIHRGGNQTQNAKIVVCSATTTPRSYKTLCIFLDNVSFGLNVMKSQIDLKFTKKIKSSLTNIIFAYLLQSRNDELINSEITESCNLAI